MYERAQVDTMATRMHEWENPLMQVVVGSRQTGKSTMIAQALRKADVRNHFVSADDAIIPSEQWLRTEWQQARNEAMRDSSPMVLIVDEVQKIPSWPRVVKSLYDADQRAMSPLRVILCGSSSLLLHKGLEDSLMGRYELVRSPHWSLAECTEAFGFTLDNYLYYGGYPGAARFAGDDLRWGSYMRDAIIEPTISQDVLALEDVRKPALMRALFRLGTTHSAQELSYTKMLGQLQGAGNTVTLAHYLDLLSKAGMICGLDKYSDKELTRRKSSPRLMVYDTSLISAVSPKGRDKLLGEPDIRGRIVESSVGARLLARSADEGFEVMWWREGVQEVDFVLRKGMALTAVEVKSGRASGQSGMGTFLARHPEARRIVVGGSVSDACTVKDFLLDGIPLF